MSNSTKTIEDALTAIECEDGTRELDEALDSLQCACSPKEITALLARLFAAEADAAQLRWLLENNSDWTWQPSRFNAEIVSGFTYRSTSYLGYQFSEAVNAARSQKMSSKVLVA